VKTLFLLLELVHTDEKFLKVRGEQNQLEAALVFLASRAPTDLKNRRT
jgi:hypothetical protein